MLVKITEPVEIIYVAQRNSSSIILRTKSPKYTDQQQKPEWLWYIFLILESPRSRGQNFSRATGSRFSCYRKRHLFSLETIAPYEDIFISCSASFIWPGNHVVVVRSHYHSSTTETMCLRLLLLRSQANTYLHPNDPALYPLFFVKNIRG